MNYDYDPYKNCSAELSHIEKTFARELDRRGWIWGEASEEVMERKFSHARLVHSYGRPWLKYKWSSPGRDIVCVSQFPVKPRSKIYFIDFAFLSNDGEILIAVELDGKEFHGSSNQKSDKYREDELISNGWNVFRFSGSEINRSVGECMEKFMPIFGSDPAQKPTSTSQRVLRHDGKIHLEDNTDNCLCQSCVAKMADRMMALLETLE